MPKTLPIQMVRTRGSQDVFKKEASGSNDIPNWITDKVVRKNAKIILERLDSLNALFEEKEASNQENLPILLTAYLYKLATAKSHRKSTRSIFNLRGKPNIIGLENINQLIVKIENRTDLNQIKRNLNGYNTQSMSKEKRSGIASIVDLKLFTPIMHKDDLIGKTVKVKLVDYQNEKINNTAVKLFLKNCKDFNIETKVINYPGGLKLFRIPQATEKIIQQIATMDGILSVKPMPYIEIMASPEPDNSKLDVLLPQEGEHYPEAGLLDSGVEMIPHIKPWIKNSEQNTAGLENTDISREHGTAVAGIMLYGDQLQDENYTGCKPMWLTSCIVNTESDKVRIEEYELIEHVKEAISTNPQIKVWNLSQGSVLEVDDDTFSDFAIALDNIQKEFNVLICKSAGNQEHPESGHIRITHGAESIRSLVVGSISHESNGNKDGEKNHRSPFSRIGFGPEYLVKPDLVHYGGNMQTGVQSFSYTGFQTNLCKGTSFSTPRVTALAANLANQLNRDFDPILIKALLIHSAIYPDMNNESSETLLKELGYGVPNNINNILNNDADEFTMVWQPEFEIGSDFLILDFPFPDCMINEQGVFYGDITVTLVTDPILKETEGSEYCQSDVEVLLETYSNTEYYRLGTAGTPQSYRNAIRPQNTINVLAKKNYGIASFKHKDFCERTLIENNHKYQPVKKYHVILDKMTPANKNTALKGDRHWCVKIKALYRDATDAEREEYGIEEIVKTTILITIRDTKHKGLIYNECMQLLEQRNFEHNNIAVQQHLEINNRD